MEGYLSIPEAARRGIMPEYRLRMRLKAGKLPGIWCGTKFMISVSALAEMLEAESKAAITEN